MKKNFSLWLAAELLLIFAMAVSAMAQRKPLPAKADDRNSAPTQRKKPLPPHSINLNSAGAEELQQLPGIGPKLAKAIVTLREKSGPFRRVEDLLAVPHITRRTIEKIRPYVTVGKTQ